MDRPIRDRPVRMFVEERLLGRHLHGIVRPLDLVVGEEAVQSALKMRHENAAFRGQRRVERRQTACIGDEAGIEARALGRHGGGMADPAELKALAAQIAAKLD